MASVQGPRLLVTGAIVLVLSLFFAGCSTPANGAAGGEVPPRDAEGRYVISMTSALMFVPSVAKVPVGATVVWRNDATMDHDVAGYRGDPIEEDVEAFSSYRQPPEGLGRPIHPGENFTRTFSAAGDWTLWCHAHHEEGMKGVVRVE
jgi:plastocyanin